MIIAFTRRIKGPEANTTSLVIKGIMGIRSMAEIARAFGDESATERYLTVATDMTGKFLQLATSKDLSHLVAHYGNDTSWHLQVSPD